MTRLLLLATALVFAGHAPADTTGRGAEPSASSTAKLAGKVPVTPPAPRSTKSARVSISLVDGGRGALWRERVVAEQPLQWVRSPSATAPPSTYYVTGYVADHDCEPWCDGVTASGTPADPSLRIVACPARYRFGTRFRIEGLGAFTCRDRGSAVVGNRLDVLVETKPQARRVTGVREIVVLGGS